MQQKYRNIKLALPLLLSIVLLSSCTGSATSSLDESIKITIVDGNNFSVNKNVFDVKKGDNVSVDLSFDSGYAFSSCSYQNFSIATTTPKSTTILLKDIRFPQRVEFTAKIADCTIMYSLNGGSFYDEDRTDEYFIKWPNLSYHSRPNTEIGINTIYRDGYTLTNWNTKEDGSGLSIGLGSRITLPNYKFVLLFAQWEKQLTASDFQYSILNNEVTLNKFTGAATGEKLVLPSKIENRKVVFVGNSCFSNLNYDTLVIPHSITKLTAPTFVNCSFNEIIFSDNLMTIGDNCFSSPIKKWHLNAASFPKYQADNDNCQFAENMDHLILNQDKKKLLFFAGCSMSYGLNSQLVNDTFGNEYVNLNMGVIGGTNAGFQFDCITKYISEGDVFIHAPEEGSPYQNMDDINAEIRMFIMCEGNYDLLSLCDMSSIGKPFSVFGEYAKSRSELPSVTYESHLTTYNSYGDISISRPFTNESKRFSSDKYTYKPEYINETSLARLAQKYDAIKNKGGKVLVSYAPMNYAAMEKVDFDDLVWDRYATNLSLGLEKYGYPVISDVSDYLMDGTMFYDEDYHLNEVGAVKRTEQLIADIQKKLN
ncbi:MAG: leucine-rich repeat protein [Bacilli bacterium]